ncbi:MAG: hypothetical protein ACYDAG_02640, partial [Chloroflexota bacterium]
MIEKLAPLVRPRAGAARWSRATRRTLRGVGLYLASGIFVAWALAPVVWVFISSISTRRELYAVPIKHWIPQHPTLANYARI